VASLRPFTIADQRHMTAAEGYAELGMYLDANAELGKLARSPRSTP